MKKTYLEKRKIIGYIADLITIMAFLTFVVLTVGMIEAWKITAVPFIIDVVCFVWLSFIAWANK